MPEVGLSCTPAFNENANDFFSGIYLGFQFEQDALLPQSIPHTFLLVVLCFALKGENIHK